MSSISTIAQIASPVAQIIFIAVVGWGYWYTARVSYLTIQEMRDERLDMGRPMVLVYTGTERLPELQLVVQNVGPGPAKGVSFGFSAPLESSDGSVLSQLPIFERGLPSLEPGAKIECYWDDLGDLLPFLRENERTADNVTVTVRYTDLTGNRYEHDWDIEPAVFEGVRQPGARGMDDLVGAVEGLSDGDTDGREDGGRPTARRGNDAEGG